MEQKTKDIHAIRWISESEHIDIETGEVISKKKAERDYVKIKFHKRTRINGIYGYITYTYEYEKNRQLRLY